MLTPAQFKIINLIYDAALNPTIWSTVVEEIMAITGAEKANLLIYDQLDPDSLVVHHAGYKNINDIILRYQQEDLASLDKSFSSSWMPNNGEVYANHKVFNGIEEYKLSAGRLYSDFFKEIDILYQMGSVFQNTQYRWEVLGLHRGLTSNPFEDDVINQITRLAPHFRRALEIHRQMNVVQEKTKVLHSLLNQMTTGVILLDHKLSVRFINNHGEDLLRQQKSLYLTHNNQISANHANQLYLLKHLISSAISPHKTGHMNAAPSGAIRIGGKEKSLLLTIIPISEMTDFTELVNENISVGIFFSDPQANQKLSHRLLANHFKLTPLEIKVAEAFLNYIEFEKTAESCGLTLSSTRTYMKNIYEKTERHSQAELMQLLMELKINFQHFL